MKKSGSNLINQHWRKKKINQFLTLDHTTTGKCKQEERNQWSYVPPQNSEPQRRKLMVSDHSVALIFTPDCMEMWFYHPLIPMPLGPGPWRSAWEISQGQVLKITVCQAGLLLSSRNMVLNLGLQKVPVLGLRMLNMAWRKLLMFGKGVFKHQLENPVINTHLNSMENNNTLWGILVHKIHVFDYALLR